MRDMTAGVQAEVALPEVQPIVLVELEFDSGTTRVWSGYGDLIWNSQTWVGVGDLGRISPIGETRDVRAQPVTLELSGIPAANVALALSEPFQQRPGRIYLGFVDDAVSVVADPVLLYEGDMDGMPVQDDGQSAVITLSMESRLARLKRTAERRSTDQDQRIDYPNDRAYEFVAALQDKDIRWGP